MLATVNTVQHEVEDFEECILDTGASKHFVNDQDLLHNQRQEITESVLPNGERMVTEVVGDIKLSTMVEGKVNSVMIKNVHYFPGLPINLISFGLLEDRGCGLQIGKRRFLVMQSTQEKIFEIGKRNSVLTLKVRYALPKQEPVINALE